MSKSIGSVALERRVDALFSRYTRPGSPGAVAAVMRGGEIELCKGYGLASIELGVPIGPKTRFRIASVSKQFTVSAALMLAAEGKLKLSDPPHKYLKELKPLPVTIDQMMRNASGLPDFLELLRLGGHGLDKPARPEDLLAACVRNTPSQLRAGQPLPLQQQQLPAARPDHREAGRHEAGRLPRRAHLQAARHDQHPAGARDRHGDPGSRHGLSRRFRERLPPRRARLSAGRRRRPHLDRRGPADLEPAFRPAGAVAQGTAGATRRRGAAHRRPCQQVSPRRAGRRHARPRHGRSWRPVAGLSHGIPARAAGRPHRRGDRQSGQHRSVATVARHRDAGAGRRQAAEARPARHHARPRSSRSPAPGSTPRSRRCSTWRGATARRR